MTPPPLTGTYRVQVHAGFTLDDARAVVPYLHRLGVSHLYSSPILTARPGSTHGYDVVDPRTVNPELGGDAARQALVRTLHEHGMGMALDIVPNHMGADAANPFWTDVLARGEASPYAAWFDIDWHAPGALRGRVLLPALGDELDVVLGRGELQAVHEAGRWQLAYFEHRFPLDPDTAARPRDADMGSGAALRPLLDRQHYELAAWRRASREINYRRFFDINDLVALRAEDPAVFHATHALVLSWVADGSIDALRIDHVDGLLDPRGYLRRLREAVRRCRPGSHVPVYVEKILSPGERLRQDWPVDGTTGYEFLSDLEAILIDPAGVAAITRAYRNDGAAAGDFADVALRAKLEVLEGAFGSEVGRLARLLRAAAPDAPNGDPIAADDAAIAVQRFIAVLPVYRTYIAPDSGALDEGDRIAIERAVTAAISHWSNASDVALVAAILRSAAAEDNTAAYREGVVRFALRLQQTSGPATAKGVEDTALYRDVPLVSLNEVGGSPDRPLDDACARLHAANAGRAAAWPRSLLTTTTHDTKRSADVRARLDVLSELPEVWLAQVDAWRRAIAPLIARHDAAHAPDVNTTYLLFQTLVGIWPVGASDEDRAAVCARVDAYMRKAAREARDRTSWTDPDESFEAALSALVQTLVVGAAGAPFRAGLERLVARVAAPGMWNALARTLVHLTAPGTPDLYQGDEIWNLSLVDPDNRRPVDYAARERMLDDLDRRLAAGGGAPPLCRDLVATAPDGRIKLHVVRTALGARRDDPDLFAAGGYLPLATDGSRHEHLFAFARAYQGRAAIVVVPRRTVALAGDDAPGAAPLGVAAWGDTRVRIPGDVAAAALTNRFDGRTFELRVHATAGVDLRVAELLADFPVALLHAVE